ncbi:MULTISPECIES: Wzz/FepE/Etk N-terminal domain-containing protein [unclassified Actinomyces]|uniref:Wzz/FepE/Etk N-terminal domain-containing protein n=1 Tax=unclassified Actinomyces TaxID=2609248 RepID=UPI00131EF9A9|nr:MULTISPECIES: Wzz/FepE/Etk N-terminal domain-containing protein [unclassified Actinomyces]
MTPDRIVRALRRRWPVVAALSLLAAVLGVLSAAVTPPVYRSTVTSILAVSSFDGVSNVTSAANIINTVAPTLAEISTSRSMLDSVAAETGIPAEETAAHITVSNPTDTLLIVVRATGPSPDQAEAIAAAATHALAEHASSMNVTIGSTNVHLSLSEVDASPTAQLIGPSKSRYGTIGLIVGGWLGLAVTLALETGQRTMHANPSPQPRPNRP